MSTDPFAAVDTVGYPSCDEALSLTGETGDDIIVNFLAKYGITPELALFIGLIIGLILGYLMVVYLK